MTTERSGPPAAVPVAGDRATTPAAIAGDGQARMLTLENGDLCELHYNSEMVMVKVTAQRNAVTLAFTIAEWRTLARAVPALLLVKA